MSPFSPMEKSAPLSRERTTIRSPPFRPVTGTLIVRVATICYDYADEARSRRLWENELPRSKLRGIKPPLAYSHGPASLAGWMLVYLVYVLHANLRTTPTGRLGDAVAYSLFHCPAAEHTGE